jgi:hypothetical protein
MFNWYENKISTHRVRRSGMMPKGTATSCEYTEAAALLSSVLVARWTPKWRPKIRFLAEGPLRADKSERLVKIEVPKSTCLITRGRA